MSSMDVHQGCTMGELYVRAARRYPDRIALVGAHDSISYRELGEHYKCDHDPNRPELLAAYG